MSVLAVEEYEELHVNFELEKNLRKKAESFAQEVSCQGKGIWQNEDIVTGQNLISLDDLISIPSSHPALHMT